MTASKYEPRFPCPSCKVTVRRGADGKLLFHYMAPGLRPLCPGEGDR